MALGRFTLALLFLTLSLFSSPQDFKSCQLKYQVSSIAIENTLGFAINDEYVLFYSEKEPKVKIIKRDPFLGLNLMKADKTFKHIFKFYENKPSHLAAVLPKHVVEGRLVREQVGLNRLGIFSQMTRPNSLISGTCCGIIGLSTGSETGIIQKDYIRHFLEAKEIGYSDIGIRLADKKGVRVVEVNPFFENSPFLLDDIILYMDNKKSMSAAKLSQDILFSKIGSTHYFLIFRDGKNMKLRATFKRRLSGGLVPDSFFGLFGLELDENLVVKKDNKKYSINKGDRLLSLMKKPVNNLKQIREILSLEKTSKNELIVLMLQRNGFDFFIHFDKPINSN